MTSLSVTNRDIDKVIGARIRAERLRRGMSQETLGKAIGVTFQQIQKYEKGVNRIAVSTLFGISRAFALVPTAFFHEIAGEIEVPE